MKLVVGLIFILLMSGPAFSYNAWLTLSSKKQNELTLLLRPDIKTACNKGFKDWYEKWFCKKSDGKKCYCGHKKSDLYAHYPQWKYNSFDIGKRAVANCGAELLSKDGVLWHVKSFYKMDHTGWFLINVKNKKKLWNALSSAGYDDSYKASRGDKKGVRSATVGVGLHWVQDKGKLFNTHIDLKNPGVATMLTLPGIYAARAAEHISYDLWGWEDRTAKFIVNHFPSKCGLSANEKFLLGL